MKTIKDYRNKYSDITSLFEASVNSEARSLVTEKDLEMQRNAKEADESENLNTTPKRLAELSDSPYFLVRMRVAKHPNTSEETLKKLAEDKDPDVRQFAIESLKSKNIVDQERNINIDDFTTPEDFISALSRFIDITPPKSYSDITITLDDKMLLDISIKKRTDRSTIPIALKIENAGWKDFSNTQEASTSAYNTILPFVREAILIKENNENELEIENYSI